MRECMQKS